MATRKHTGVDHNIGARRRLLLFIVKEEEKLNGRISCRLTMSASNYHIHAL